MAETARRRLLDAIQGGSPTAGSFGRVTPGSFGRVTPGSFVQSEPIKHRTRTTPTIGGTPITRFAKPEREDGGFKGAFGKLIDVIDFPAAMARSGVKEGIDFVSNLAQGKNPFGEGGASLGEWWEQTNDHMLMSEVLRETGIAEKLGIEPGSKTEMALGFGLDIFTDPIVWATGGMGAVPRVLKGMGKVDEVVKALTKASGLAATPAKAAELTAAAARVSKSKSILSAGKALEDIGIKHGLTLTIPGTGRLGRHIVERPLSFATGGAVGKATRAQRAKYVPAFVLSDKAFDVQRYAPQIADSMKLLKKGETAVADMLLKGGIPKEFHKSIMDAAAFGRRLPITLPFTMPWSTPLLRVVAPLPGYAMRLATQTKVVQMADNALNARAPIRRLRLSDDPDTALAGVFVEEAANKAAVAAGTFRGKLLGAPGKPPVGWRMAAKAADVPEEGSGAMRLADKMRDFKISSEDMMRASDRPTFVNGMINPELPESFRRLGSRGVEFHEELLKWWDDARRLTNDALGETRLAGFADDLYAARYLSTAGKKILGGEGFEFTGPALGGSPWKPRTILSPGAYDDKVARLGEAEAERLYTNSFLGEMFESPIKTGRSILDQRDEIGKRILGEQEYKGLFSDDFNEVVQRYIHNMAQGVQEGNVLRELKNVGVVYRSDAGGISMDLTKRLKQIVGEDGTIKQFEGKINASRVGAARLRQVDEAAEGVELVGAAGLPTPASSVPEMLAPELGRRINAATRAVEGLQAGKATWLPKDLRAAIKAVNSLGELPTEGWARVMSEYAGFADDIGWEIRRLRQMVDGVDAAAKRAGARGYAQLQVQSRSVAVLESALAQMNGRMARGALNDRTVRAADQVVKTLQTGRMPSSVLPEIKGWAKKYQEGVDLDNLTGSTAYLHAADDDFLKAVVTQLNRGTVAHYGPPPTPEEWIKMAQRGKIHAATGEALPGEAGAATSYAFGRINGYTEDDIARFYLEINTEGATAATIGTLRPPTDKDLLVGYNKYVTDRNQWYKEMAREWREELPDLAYIADKVAQTEAGVLAKSRVYNEALEEAKAAAEKWQANAPDLERGLEEARLLAQEDILTPDQLFNQQKYLQSAKEQAMELELEMNRARQSAELGRRISAADSQEQAREMINQERNLRGFQHAYNEALSNQMTGPFLKGYSAVNMKESADLFASATLAAAKLNNAKAFKEWSKGYFSLLNYWKAQAVATPGFVIRNIMGATWINSQILGVEMGQHTKTSAMKRAAMRASIDATKDKKYHQYLEGVAKARNIPIEVPVAGQISSGSQYLLYVTRTTGKPTKLGGIRGAMRNATDRDWRIFDEIDRAGIAGGGQAQIEVAEKSGLAPTGTWNPFRAHFWPFRAVRKANTEAEYMVRMTAARHIMEGGGTLDEAWKGIRKYHFDYSEITPREAQIKAIIPFWKWQKNILPVLVESIGSRPAAWSRLRQIKGELEYSSESEGIVPDYFMENLGIRLPWRMDGSQVYLLPDLPFKDLNRWMKPGERPITGIKPLDMATRIFAESAFPYAKLPIEMWAGKQFFADLPLKGRFQNVPPSYANIPGLMPIMGMLGKAEKNRKGEWKMTDTDLYVLDQLMPFMGKLRRLIPGEEKYEKRWMTTFLSTMFGGGLRVNTPEEQRNQLIRMQRELSDDMKRMIDIEVRNV